MNITYAEYKKEIQSIAEQVTEDCKDSDLDMHDYLHEVIDGHQWVIYYAYNDDVLNHSDNQDALIDQCGNEYAGQIVAEQSLDDLKTAMAYFAMHQDVSELIEWD